MVGNLNTNANLLTVAGSGKHHDLPAVISGAGGIEENSTATTTLSGANIYGGTTIH